MSKFGRQQMGIVIVSILVFVIIGICMIRGVVDNNRNAQLQNESIDNLVKNG